MKPILFCVVSLFAMAFASDLYADHQHSNCPNGQCATTGDCGAGNVGPVRAVLKNKPVRTKAKNAVKAIGSKVVGVCGRVRGAVRGSLRRCG